MKIRGLKEEKSQPAKTAYTQAASDVKTDNLHVLAKTSASVVNWPSGLVAQRSSGQAAYSSTAIYTDSDTAPSSNRKALGY